jgi:hypothetical protein
VTVDASAAASVLTPAAEVAVELLVGDNPFDFAAAGGAGAVWIRSLPGSAGTVSVSASHPVLGRAVARARVWLDPRVPSGLLRREWHPADCRLGQAAEVQPAVVLAHADDLAVGTGGTVQ